MLSETSKTVHANCVAIDGKGLLIVGASGAGKSTLTLQLLAIGADLVSDDQTTIFTDGKQLRAVAPLAIKGLIEARGVGILTMPSVPDAIIKAIVDMDEVETSRLPGLRKRTLLGVSLPCLRKVDSEGFPAGLLHYVRYGRQNVV
jgi:HPr kinase/phosphorylase